MKLLEVKESNSALRGFAKVYSIKGVADFEPLAFLQAASQNITSVIRNNRKTKVKLIFKCYMEFLKTNEIKPAHFHFKIETNLDGTEERELYDTMVERILENIATFIAKDSEIVFYSVIKLELHTTEYIPLTGETYIPLSKELAVKTAIINMKNRDNKCFFLWCVLIALNPSKKNPQRLDEELKGKENTLNMEGTKYPVSLKDFNKFEKQPCPSRY